MIKGSQIFYQIGKFAAGNKLIMVAFCLTITVVLGLGMVDIRLVSEPQDLWVNKDGRTNHEQSFFQDKFGPFFRINQLIFTLDGPETNEDIFNKSYLVDLYYLQKIIMTRNATNGNKSINVVDFCYKPISDKGCYLPSPLDFWKMNLTDLLADQDIKQTSLCLQSRDDSYIPCTDTNGIPIIKEVALGGITCANSSVTIPCNPCVLQATALSVTMMLNNDQFTSNDAQVWERDVFEDTINKFNDGTLDYSYYLPNETIVPSNRTKKVKITYLAERSIPDELVEETNQNFLVVVISYVVMFLYISVAIGAFPSLIHSGFLVGICGILVVGCSIVCAFGLSSYMDQGVSMISAEVVPFLILAIGVDNIFIIANANKRAESLQLSVTSQLGEALKEVGPSISTAAVCEFLAFIVGFTTNIPALQSFCLVAALAVFFDYLFQMTLFIAVLAMDEERRRDGRYDIFVCFKTEDIPPPRKEVVKHMIDKYYIPVLFSPVVKVLVLITFCALIIMSGFALTKLDLGLDQQVSLIKDSMTYRYFNDQAHYGDAGPPAYIVLKGINYTNQTEIGILNDMSDALSKLSKRVQPPIFSWVSAFGRILDTSNLSPSTITDCNMQYLDMMSFYEKLQFFKNIKIDSVCCKKYGICGETYEKDIVINDDGSIAASRFRFQHRPCQVSDDFINAFYETRYVVDHFSQQLYGSGEDKKAYSYSLFYVYFEQYFYIRGVAIQNLLLAVGVVYAAVVFIKNTRSAIFVFICCLCTTFDLIGACFLLNKMAGGWQVQINAVSVVNLIVCVGLSVEFSVHIMLSFMNCIGPREERAKKALSIMGSSVIVGIAVTKFLGVIVLGFADSTLFSLYYFRMFMAIIVLGFFHGLAFLPVALSLIGPKESHRTSSYDMSYGTKKGS